MTSSLFNNVLEKYQVIVTDDRRILLFQETSIGMHRPQHFMEYLQQNGGERF